jgi:hypothetical protein
MMNLFEAARQLQVFCDGQGWRSCVIGGLAVQRWGEPRVTLDVDLNVLAGFGAEGRYIDALLAAYAARIRDAGEFARRHRVLLLRTPDGVGIDVSLGALPFEERVVGRATLFSFGPGLDIRTCSAEDLVVLKLFAARPLDIRDAEGVAVRQKGQLDWQYIDAELRPLAQIKDDPAILSTLARLRGLSQSL